MQKNRMWKISEASLNIGNSIQYFLLKFILV